MLYFNSHSNRASRSLALGTIRVRKRAVLDPGMLKRAYDVCVLHVVQFGRHGGACDTAKRETERKFRAQRVYMNARRKHDNTRTSSALRVYEQTDMFQLLPHVPTMSTVSCTLLPGSSFDLHHRVVVQQYSTRSTLVKYQRRVFLFPHVTAVGR